MQQKPPAAPDPVAERAYHIWEGEGRPEGAALDHWLRAEAELAAEAPKRRRAKKKAGGAKPRARASKKAGGTETKAASTKKAARKPASRSRTRRPRGTPPSP